jgi:hypothetical protein
MAGPVVNGALPGAGRLGCCAVPGRLKGAPYVRVASEGGDTVSAYNAANGALTATIRDGINLS